MTKDQLRNAVEVAARRAEDNRDYLIAAREHLVFSREMARYSHQAIAESRAHMQRVSLKISN